MGKLIMILHTVRHTEVLLVIHLCFLSIETAVLSSNCHRRTLCNMWPNLLQRGSAYFFILQQEAPCALDSMKTSLPGSWSG